MSTLSGLAGVPGSRRSCCLRNHRVTKRVSHFVVRASTREGRTTHDDSANDTYTNNQTSPGEITELQNERIRAERMAVRLKLRSVVARGVGPKGPNAKNQRNKETPKAMTLDAAIVETKKSNAVGDGSFRNDSTRSSASNVSVSIDNERNAVRTRLERFSMTRYAFVERGDMKGRVVDRVTGHEAIDDDDDTKSNSLDDRVDLARERVKQAQQVLSHAVATANSAAAVAKQNVVDAEVLLAEKEKKLVSLAKEAREDTSSGIDGKSGARRAVLKTLGVMLDASLKTGVVPGAGARKSATVSTPIEASNSEAHDHADSELKPITDAKTRAKNAIRKQASSSLSRLRSQRKISRAGSAWKQTSASTTNSHVDGKSVDTIETLGGVGSCELTETCDAKYDRTHEPSREPSPGRPSTSQHEARPGDGSQTQTQEMLPKPIFVLSDCTGESAANTCRAALNQFAEVMNLSAPTNLYVFRFLSEGSDVYKIVKQASEDDALVVYTLSDADMATAVQTACKVFHVNSVNLWGPLLVAMENHLEMQRIGVPMSFGRGLTSTSIVGEIPRAATTRSKHSDSDVLSTDYYKMIEAVEFTRRMDDGANPKEWVNADILIVGVSRTGKTPLSIYLGQRGYKVANLPLVLRDGALMVPTQINEIDSKRVFGLLIAPDVLHVIRKNRLSNLGVGKQFAYDGAKSYAASRQVTEELSLAKALYAENSDWQVLDVTHKGVEETAARIMKLMYRNEKQNEDARIHR